MNLGSRIEQGNGMAKKKKERKIMQTMEERGLVLDL